MFYLCTYQTSARYHSDKKNILQASPGESVAAPPWDAVLLTMNNVKLTDEQKKIIRLEKCIADFKEYDNKRKDYINDVEAERDKLKESLNRANATIQNLAEKINTLIDAYDRAGPMKDNSGNRAYVTELLNQIVPSPMSTKSIERMETELAKEVLALRKGLATMQQTFEVQKRVIERLTLQLKQYENDKN